MKFSNILVDADILLYQIGFATQRNIYSVWLEGHEGDPSYVMSDKRKLNKILKLHEYELHKEIYVQPFLSASTTIDQVIAGLKKRLGTPSCNMELYLTGENNFREEVATILPYKGNRTQDKPVHYQRRKEYLIGKHQALVIGDEEADDALSYNQYRFNKEGTSSIICSIDKDLNQVPGWHYNSTKDKVYHVTQAEGIRWFYEQLLQGDSADNIPGLKGVGPKTATTILSECTGPEQMEAAVIEKYKEQYAEEDVEDIIIEVGQLLFMRTYPNEMWYPLYKGGPRVET